MLSGELGNNLYSISAAFRNKWWLERNVHVNIHHHPEDAQDDEEEEIIEIDLVVDVIGQHQDMSTTNMKKQLNKWMGPRNVIEMCMPQLTSVEKFTFEGGIWDQKSNFAEIQRQQIEWLGVKDATNKLSLQEKSDHCSNATDCRQQCANYLQSLLLLQQQQQQEQKLQQQDTVNATISIIDDYNSNDNDPTSITTPRRRTYSLPYLTSYSSSVKDIPLEEEELQRIRHLFQFDRKNPNCCSIEIAPPYENETVFHLRNFVTENKKLLSTTKSGSGGIRYHEITPKQIVPWLSGGALIPGKDSIALVGRYMDSDYAKQFQYELTTNGGYSVRMIQNQTTAQDFCFMLQTKRELIASKQSTFAQWIELLMFDGNTNVPTTFYSISPTIRWNGTNMKPLTRHPWFINSSNPLRRDIYNIPDAN